jgi:hypothetical protein
VVDEVLRQRSAGAGEREITGMEEVTLHGKNGDTDDLLARLKGRVFHLTTRTAYDAILKSGGITHNKDGRFKLNTSSEKSFGRLNGYVCLFDLRNDDQALLERVLNNYYFLGPPWFEKRQADCSVLDLAHLVLDPAYYDRLIPFARVHDHYRITGRLLQAIPHGEAWIEGHVPISWIEMVIFANVRR